MFKRNNSWRRWQAETPAACPAFFYSEILSAIVTDIHRVGMAVKQDRIYCVSLFGAAGGSAGASCFKTYICVFFSDGKNAIHIAVKICA